MHSCSPATVSTDKTASGVLTVALAGNPNSGKTTIFNALTGMRQRVANYPGITVEKKIGICSLPDGRQAVVIDLPGMYSLISRSPDELVAMEVLRGLHREGPPDAVVVVVDASNLERNLYLVSQLIEVGRPLVVALNMVDVAERRGIRIDAAALERELGVPVVPVVGHKRQGIDELKQAILRAAVAPLPDWPLPQAMKEELLVVGGALAILRPGVPHPGDRSGTAHADSAARGLGPYLALAERLLIGDHASDLQDIARHEAVGALVSSAARRMQEAGIDPMQADIEAHYRWIEGVVARCVRPAQGETDGASCAPEGARRTWTERADAVLLHRVWGLAAFAGIMASLFVAIFWLAQPLMGAVETGIQSLGQWVTSAMPAGPLKDLVTDGIFGGVGAVLVFVPQIALLFMFLAILEDSGYLARAAFLMDRALAKVGLHGKSFIPLLSSFACAIPGILATRTIENRRDRLGTVLVAPFMSCSARLPVYSLLIGVFFSSAGAVVQAGVMLGLYVLGIAAAVVTALVFKRTLLKGPAAAFILEMPTYKLPQISQVARHVWVNTREFIKRAGTIIFSLSVVMWAMAYYPRLPADQAARYADARELGAAQARHSIAGRLGRALEPVIAPLGYDWKMGVGLVGAFAAREAFVSTLGIIYGVSDSEERVADLASAMRADRYPDGRPVWTPLVAVSLLLWFVLAMQCMSTIAVVRRETGTWRWPLFMVLYMNALAYALCLALNVAGKLLG